MGHLCDIRHHRFSGNILSNRNRDPGFALLKFTGLQKIPEHDCRILTVGHFDPHRGLAGDGGLDPKVGDRQVQLDIVRKAHDLADLDALLRLQLIPGDGRPAACVCDMHLDAEILQRLLQLPGGGPKLRVRVAPGLLSLFQQMQRRHLVFLRHSLLLFPDRLFHGPGFCFHIRYGFFFRLFGTALFRCLPDALFFGRQGIRDGRFRFCFRGCVLLLPVLLGLCPADDQFLKRRFYRSLNPGLLLPGGNRLLFQIQGNRRIRGVIVHCQLVNLR